MMTKTNNSRTQRIVALLGLAMTVSIMALAEPAQAAFPGANGKIAFESLRDGNGEIYTMNPDGKEQTNLTLNPNEDEDPAVSPDGKKIACTSTRDGNEEIYVMTLDGSTAQKRLTKNAAHDSDPAFSPDGKRISFQSDRDGDFEVYTMKASGKKQKKLTKNGAFDGFPDWGVATV